MRLPDFIVAGVRKCGTTWLHRCLGEHPSIFLPASAKELFFFDKYWSRGPDWYARHFHACRPEQICGEVSPSYLMHAEAPQRIHSLLPRTKLVFIFRHPVRRVVSLYEHMRAKGDLRLSLEDAVEACPELLEEGFYARHYARFRRQFGAGALLPLVLDDTGATNAETLARLFRFLQVDAHFHPPSTQVRIYERREARSYPIARSAAAASRLLHRAGLHKVVQVASLAGTRKIILRERPVSSAPPSPRVIERLHQLYDAEVAQLSEMVELDLRGLWRFGPQSPMIRRGAQE